MTQYRILHVTDIHAAPKLDPWIVSKLKELRQDEGAFDACIFSGDIADQSDFAVSGSENNQAQSPVRNAFDTLEQVLDSANGKDKRPPLIITPGNHDARRPKAFDDSGDPFEEYERELRGRFPNAFAPSSKTPETTIFKCGPLMVFPLSTCDLLYQIKDNRLTDNIRKSLSHLGLSDEQLKDLIKVVISHSPAIGAIDHLIEHQGPLYKALSGNTQGATGPWIRLAVSHHPLWGVPHAQDHLEPFDIATNGVAAVEALQKLGFSVYVHGHTHYMGASLFKGLRSAADRHLTDIRAAVSISGGHLNRKIKPSGAGYGFQTITVTDNQDDTATLSVRNYVYQELLRKFNEYDICRMTIMRNSESVGASLRWIDQPFVVQDSAFPESSRSTIRAELKPTDADWVQHLSSDIQRETGFESLVRTLERELHQSSSDDNIDHVDQVLSSTMIANRLFIDGGDERGVDLEYRRILDASFATKSAMVFVDVAGNETWGHPNLIENTQDMFRRYYENNRSRRKTRPHDWIQGKDAWVWTHPVGEFQDCFLRLFDGTTGMKEKKGRSKSRGTLSFGLCRILVWKASAFLSSQALTLLTLHRHAGVPVLFVDIDRFSRESVFGEQKKDMHLEWNEGCNDPSGGYWFSNANDPSSVVAKRDQISEKAMRGASQYCSELLDYAQCPFRLETVKRIFERAEK